MIAITTNRADKTACGLCYAASSQSTTLAPILPSPSSNLKSTPLLTTQSRQSRKKKYSNTTTSPILILILLSHCILPR